MIVYKATCLLDNKCYIGLTIHTLEKRKSAHLNLCRRNSQSHFYRAIRLHGEDNFCWEILEKCDTRTQLKEREIFWINHFKSNDQTHGYNMTNGGDGCLNPSQSTRAKLSTAIKNRMPYSKEIMDKIANSNKAYHKRRKELGIKIIREYKPLSEEQKRKISESGKGRVVTQETREKISKGNKGKLKGRKISEQHRLKIGLATKGKNNPMHGKKHSEATKQKISLLKMGGPAWNKGKNRTPEEIDRIKAGIAEARKLKPRSAWNKGVPRTQTEKDNMKAGKLKAKLLNIRSEA
jgi:group I intron endonuclease